MHIVEQCWGSLGARRTHCGRSRIVFVTKGHSFNLNNRPTQLPRVEEAKRKSNLVFDRLDDCLLLDDLDATLHETRALRVVAKFVHKLLHVLHLHHLGFVLFLLHDAHLLVSRLVRVIVTAEVGQLEVRETHDVRADFVQEGLVVGDQQHGFGVALEVLFQPQDRLQIQVIGRLIEHEQVWLHQQRTRQRHTHAPTSRQRRSGRVLHCIRELQSGQNHGRAGLRGGHANLLHAFAELGHLVHDGLLLGSVVRGYAELFVELFFLVQQGGALDVGAQHDLQHALGGGLHFLLHVQHTMMSGKSFNVEVCHVLEQRGLTHTVSTNQTISSTIDQAQISILQQKVSTEGNVKVGHMDILFTVISSQIRQRHVRNSVVVLLFLLVLMELGFQVVQPLLLLLGGLALVFQRVRRSSFSHLHHVVTLLSDIGETPHGFDGSFLGVRELCVCNRGESNSLVEKLRGECLVRHFDHVLLLNSQTLQLIAELVANALSLFKISSQAITFKKWRHVLF
mmetsp:Transcript_42452/g.73847  ORF Transcript_42452/g.73847 Transcript_42452/m.73847 type:complete len:508 (+) Transcript_42452:634-2157(+)